jgi:hypothetical protein
MKSFYELSAWGRSSRLKFGWLPRFSLRTLLVMVGVLGVLLGCVGIFWQRLHRQRQIVGAIREAGGQVRYDYEFGMGSDLDFPLLTIDDTPISFEESKNGQRKRTRVTSAGTVVDVETPRGPKAIRRIFGDDAFAHVESVEFLWHSQPPEKFDPRLLLELPQLKLVWLWHAQVNDEWIDCVARAAELRILNLLGETKGVATGEGLAQLQAAKHLQSLGLSGEWVRDETITGVSRLRQLKALGIGSDANVTSAMFQNLVELTELRELTIVRAKRIDDQGAEHLGRMQNLRTLWLSQTSITDASLAHVSKLSQLEWLDVSVTSIGDAGMEFLIELPHLRRLNLRYTRVGDAGLDSLSGLPQLRYLHLEGTSVTDAGMPAIARMTQLESLDLNPSSVTDEGVRQLKTLARLKRLRIGPHVTKEGFKELKRALPHCNITAVDQAGIHLILDR